MVHIQAGVALKEVHCIHQVNVPVMKYPEVTQVETTGVTYIHYEQISTRAIVWKSKYIIAILPTGEKLTILFWNLNTKELQKTHSCVTIMYLGKLLSPEKENALKW